MTVGKQKSQSVPLGGLFDPDLDLRITEHNLPHWGQAGTIAFVTLRLADSIPKSVLMRWEQEKNAWIRRKTGKCISWKEALPTLDQELQNEFKSEFRRRQERCLDQCHGSCVLRNRDLAQIVYDSLLFFDGDRYRMGDFIIMPNHVHCLVSFPDEGAMVIQYDSWQHYTAFQINKKLGTCGKLWKQDPFDHLVRSLDQYEYYRSYIRNNGNKARLPPSDFLYRQFPG